MRNLFWTPYNSNRKTQYTQSPHLITYMLWCEKARISIPLTGDIISKPPAPGVNACAPGVLGKYAEFGVMGGCPLGVAGM